jgi:hypothetical protein
MARAKLDGFFKVAAHPHRERFETMTCGNLVQERKMGGRRLIDRRNTHETVNIESPFLTAFFNKIVGVFRGDARFLRFFTRIDLNIEFRAPLRFLQFLGKGFGD